MTTARHTLATVIDLHPRFRVELILWATCVDAAIPRADFRPLVYFIDEAPSDLAQWLDRRGIEHRIAASPVPLSPHCNKLLPFLDSQPTDHVVFADADLYFVANPAGLIAPGTIQAAPNNHCNPPGRVFRELLAAVGLAHAYLPGVSLMANADGSRETYLNNISAGIVGMPAATAAEFAPRWMEKARWLIAHRHLLGPWAVHVDQVGFALAMAERNEQVLFLPPQANLVLHMLAQCDTAYAFHLTTGHVPHFPARFHPDGQLSDADASPTMKNSLGVLNACIACAREEILRLPSTRNHIDMFLNPSWLR
jgi:hypothetical protein